jgi:protease-4
VTYERIVSGEGKDIGTPFRNLTKEERAKIEYIVNETFLYFLTDIAKNRNLTKEQIEKISSGDVFLAKDAVDLGLIDYLGTIEDAKELAKNMTKSIKPEFVSLKKGRLSLLDLLG